MLEAIQAAPTTGQTTYTFEGQTRSIYDRGRWQGIVTEAGVDAGLAAAYRGQTDYNQRTTNENNLQDTARNLQAQVDVVPRINRAYLSVTRTAGIADRATQTRVASLISQGMISGDITPEQRQDPEAIANYLADRMNVDRNDTVKMNQFRRVASLGWGALDRNIRRDRRTQAYGGADPFVSAAYSPTLRAEASVRDQAQIDSRMQTAMASFGGEGGPMRRIVDALAGGTPGTSVRDLVAQTLGWFPTGDVGNALEGQLVQLQADLRTYHNPAPGTTPAQQAEVRRRVLQNIRNRSTAMRQAVERAGISAGAGVSTTDAARVWQAGRDRRAGFVTESDALAERMLYDDRSLEQLGAGGLGTIQRVQERNQQLRQLAAEHTGGNMEKLLSANAALPDAIRGRVDQLREAQMRDLQTVQTSLREGRSTAITAENRALIDTERRTRGRSNTDVLGNLLTTLGVGSALTVAEREAMARDVMVGDRGNAIRFALPALQRLRVIARTHGADTAEKFQDWLRAGPRAEATDEERRLFNRVTAGLGGRGGFVGIGRDNLHREAIQSQLRQFNPGQRDPATPTQPGASGAGTGQPQQITMSGTLTIPGLGTGNVSAQGRGGPHAA